MPRPLEPVECAAFFGEFQPAYCTLEDNAQHHGTGSRSVIY